MAAAAATYSIRFEVDVPALDELKKKIKQIDKLCKQVKATKVKMRLVAVAGSPNKP